MIGIDVCDPFSRRDIDIIIIDVKPLVDARAIKGSCPRASCSVANRELQPPNLPVFAATVHSVLGR